MRKYDCEHASGWVWGGGSEGKILGRQEWGPKPQHSGKKPGMMVFTCNPSTGETEGVSLELACYLTQPDLGALGSGRDPASTYMSVHTYTARRWTLSVAMVVSQSPPLLFSLLSLLHLPFPLFFSASPSFPAFSLLLLSSL